MQDRLFQAGRKALHGCARLGVQNGAHSRGARGALVTQPRPVAGSPHWPRSTAGWRIQDVQAVMTVVGGKIVHARAPFER